MQSKRSSVQNLLSVNKVHPSHAVQFDNQRFDFSTQAEPHGQLVRCTGGALELFGHSGEWVIPANHMVYIPEGRMFRLRARLPSGAVVIKFCRNEVAWQHDGCWVGPVPEFAARMIDYAKKWDLQSNRTNPKPISFFVTLGDMLPDWFRHERIHWTPYADNTAIQRVINFANQQGPRVTLHQAAQHAGMSERTLRRHMRSELGQSWREFIRELRMNRAMTMLRRNDKSITETAFEVGFASSSSFAYAFLNYVGKTPSEYARSFS
jgi:AraC-like DNA-binding protein